MAQTGAALGSPAIGAVSTPPPSEFQGDALRSLLGSALAVSVGFSSLVIFSFSVFLKPVTEAYGWGRGETSLAFSLTAITVAFASPVLGRLVDRVGARRVALVCTLCYVAALASLGALDGSRWHWFGAYFLMGVVGNGTTQLPYARVVCGWFVRQRGLALAVMMLGVGLGAVAVPPLTQWLITSRGIDGAYLVLALLAGLFALPSLLFLVRENPAENARESLVPPQPELTSPMSAPIRSGWTLTKVLPFAAFFLVSFSANGVMAHLSALLTDRGFQPESAAIALSAMGVMVLLGRVLAGWLLDRFDTAWVSAGLFGASVVGILLLLTSPSLALAATAAALIGLSMGAEADVMPFLVSRMFPLHRFTEMYGYAFSVFAFGGAAGPALMGQGYDRMQSYQPILVAMAVCASLAVVLMLASRTRLARL